MKDRYIIAVLAVFLQIAVLVGCSGRESNSIEIASVNGEKILASDLDLAKAQYESKNMLDAELLDGLIKERIVLQYGEKIEDIITEEDVEKIANKTIEQQKAVYDENFMKLDEVGSKTSIDKDDVDNDDPLYNDIVEFVISTRKASASLLQRRFKLGYNRAARIIDLLEERGIIGPANGSKPREVLVDNDEEDEE